MRNHLSTLTLAILLASGAASAQVQPAPATPAGATPTARGTVDIGGMFTTTDGDEARFERYRDQRDGVYTGLSVNREGTNYLFDATAYLSVRHYTLGIADMIATVDPGLLDAQVGGIAGVLLIAAVTVGALWMAVSRLETLELSEAE